MESKKQTKVEVKEVDPIAIATLGIAAVGAYPAAKAIFKDVKKAIKK